MTARSLNTLAPFIRRSRFVRFLLVREQPSNTQWWTFSLLMQPDTLVAPNFSRSIDPWTPHATHHTKKVADYISGVDFRDGTGPSALPPNDVARAFRDAEDFALLGRSQKFWSRLTGGDHGRQDQHHPRAGGGGGRAGVGRAGNGGGRGGGASGRRRRVVHVESATTGKFFKVSRDKHGSWSSRGSTVVWNKHGVRRPAYSKG